MKPKSANLHLAILLAAGRGKRLKPHTDSTPKPLLPVNGKPTLDLYFDNLSSVGIHNAVLVTHYLAEQVEAYSANTFQRFGVSSTTVAQSQLDGTASALEAVLQSNSAGEPIASLLAGDTDESFLLMATDYLIPPAFIAELLEFHASHDSDVTISLKRVPVEELASRSSVRFDDAGLVTEIVEKPEPGKAPSDLSANLAFILPSGVLDYVPNVETSARGEREVQSAINAYLNDGRGSARGLVQVTPEEWSPSRQ